jgi:hypothetical protein
MVPETVAPLAGEVIETVGGGVFELLTVTITPALVALLPAVSFAIALSVCEPLLAVVVFHKTEYGAAESRAPRLEPSN